MAGERLSFSRERRDKNNSDLIRIDRNSSSASKETTVAPNIFMSNVLLNSIEYDKNKTKKNSNLSFSENVKTGSNEFTMQKGELVTDSIQKKQELLSQIGGVTVDNVTTKISELDNAGRYDYLETNFIDAEGILSLPVPEVGEKGYDRKFEVKDTADTKKSNDNLIYSNTVGVLLDGLKPSKTKLKKAIGSLSESISGRSTYNEEKLPKNPTSYPFVHYLKYMLKNPMIWLISFLLVLLIFSVGIIN